MRATWWTRTRSCLRSPNLVPNSIESESPPATGQASPWEDPMRSPPLVLDTVSFLNRKTSLSQGRLWMALWHLQENGALPLSLCQPLSLGLDYRREKSSFTFRPHTVFHVKDRSRKANLSASPWLFSSGIPRPPLHGRWLQACLRTVSFRSFQSNLEKDCCCASHVLLSNGSTDNR